ncbi:GGDEF domain-containing protein [Nocardioides anomalus]|uniref:GGDEF domain-containing protein n=1 Tax=Nocardioides anomalus TaxID=2712223 RepID=A0A6G6WG53_9ACTN|nr:GGDEF domain-containing protein [Nocardioides anomalus]QIG44137.1 GGDEF domain-containing protein [Nocardioides anomalus]
MRGNRVSVVTSVGTGVVLVILAVTTLVGMISMQRANDRVLAARELVTPYLALQRAVADEAAAEAGYRRAPSEAAFGVFERAVVAVVSSAAEVRAVADPRDKAVLLHIEHLNDRYSAAVRFSLAVPPSGPVEDLVAGPALGEMQDLLDAEISRHRNESLAALRDQEAVTGRLTVVLPVTFLLSFLVLGLSWRLMVLRHRRLRVEATHHMERALTDPLTGLPNREALRIAVDMALSRPKTQAALLFLDLDGFKPINDVHGHKAGDLVLQEVAGRLLATLRAGEVAARIGGDEFVVFLPRGLDAAMVKKRVSAEIEKPFLVGGRELRVGVSIGTAHYPKDGQDQESLLRAADAEMYDAKRARRASGRGTHREPRVLGRR